MSFIPGIPDVATWAIFIGIPAAAIFGFAFGLYFRTVEEKRMWLHVGIVVLCGMMTFMIIGLGTLYSYISPIYGYDTAGAVMITIFITLMLKDSNHRTILQRFIDPIMKPIENKMDRAAHPEDYNSDGTRKKARW